MDNTQKNVDESFRDSLATVTADGKRKWIFPKRPSGFFYKARTVVSVLLLVFLFGAPFIKIDGHPFILLNIFDRNFIIFGIPFGPHDLHLFALTMIAVIVSIFLFTVIYGRLFCGWVCPQTVFMEMVFRKIEYWIEGDWKKQIALKNAPWTGEKIFKKSLKQIFFFSISFLIGNTFLAYIIGVDEVFRYIKDTPTQHFSTFIAVLIFSGIFYFIFSYFREQACIILCPYGRLQGVLLDPNSIVIHYDYKRGEPRGKIKKDEITNNGDCIDCHLCVDVCPTGIDIRNGTQLECVNCTACIDVCDSVMAKVYRPQKLIKYASKNEIETGKRSILTARAIGYSIVLILLTALISYLLATRSDVELTILRTPGMLYQEQPDNKISNFYDVKIINKTFNSLPVSLSLENIEGEIRLIGSDELVAAPQKLAEAKFLIILSKDDIKELRTRILVAVKSNGSIIDVIETSFIGRTN
ncbi:MAG: cytochrome c oxidase accessory protein CcoG [Melioribacteraceae bacterium]|nr:cytochrome c oxidase accessory protein CcoG [Melioribacteraceae bacterium]